MKSTGLRGALLSCKNQNLSYFIRQKLLSYGINLQLASDYYDLITKLEIINFDFVIIDTNTVEIVDSLLKLFGLKTSRFYVPHIIYVGNKMLEFNEACDEGAFVKDTDLQENFDEIFTKMYLDLKLKNLNKNEIDENKITDYLKDFGISPKHIGFFYIKDGICYVLRKNKTFSLSKEIYPILSQKYNTSISNIEKSIRYAIQNGFNENNKYLRRVTNKEFLANAVNCITSNN